MQRLVHHARRHGVQVEGGFGAGFLVEAHDEHAVAVVAQAGLEGVGKGGKTAQLRGKVLTKPIWRAPSQVGEYVGFSGMAAPRANEEGGVGPARGDSATAVLPKRGDSSGGRTASSTCGTVGSARSARCGMPRRATIRRGPAARRPRCTRTSAGTASSGAWASTGRRRLDWVDGCCAVMHASSSARRGHGVPRIGERGGEHDVRCAHDAWRCTHRCP